MSRRRAWLPSKTGLRRRKASESGRLSSHCFRFAVDCSKARRMSQSCLNVKSASVFSPLKWSVSRCFRWAESMWPTSKETLDMPDLSWLHFVHCLKCLFKRS